MDSPGGITLDIKSKRLFWVDTLRRHIGTLVPYKEGYHYEQFEIQNKLYTSPNTLVYMRRACTGPEAKAVGIVPQYSSKILKLLKNMRQSYPTQV